MATLSNWSPYDEYVQGGMVDGQFMSAAYTLLAAGPPRLANMGGDFLTAAAGGFADAAASQLAFPIGLCQNWSLGQNMNISRVFEIGSVRSYFIPGRTMGQVSLSRVMYHGPSLLRVLYAHYSDILGSTIFPSIIASPGALANVHDVVIPPGYGNVFLNLASDLFSQPFGLMMMFKDSNEDTVSASYLESCYVPNHNIGVDAMGVVIQESAGIQYERLVPVNVPALDLITGILGG